MVFKVMYKFSNEEKQYTCYMTYEQYCNFKKLPSVQNITIVKRNQIEMKEYKDEMQHAINKAVENNSTHIKRLSENV